MYLIISYPSIFVQDAQFWVCDSPPTCFGNPPFVAYLSGDHLRYPSHVCPKIYNIPSEVLISTVHLVFTFYYRFSGAFSMLLDYAVLAWCRRISVITDLSMHSGIIGVVTTTTPSIFPSSITLRTLCLSTTTENQIILNVLKNTNMKRHVLPV